MLAADSPEPLFSTATGCSIVAVLRGAITPSSPTRRTAAGRRCARATRTNFVGGDRWRRPAHRRRPRFRRTDRARSPRTSHAGAARAVTVWRMVRRRLGGTEAYKPHEPHRRRARCSRSAGSNRAVTQCRISVTSNGGRLGVAIRVSPFAQHASGCPGGSRRSASRSSAVLGGGASANQVSATARSKDGVAVAATQLLERFKTGEGNRRAEVLDALAVHKRRRGLTMFARSRRLPIPGSPAIGQSARLPLRCPRASTTCQRFNATDEAKTRGGKPEA